MGSGISDYGLGVWVGALVQAVPLPGSYYVALVVTEPGEASDGDVLVDIEPSDSAYHRRRYGVGPAQWAVAENYVTNLNEISFGTATVDWGFLTHYVLTTAAVSGEIFAWGELLNPTFVQAGFAVTLPVGGIVLAGSKLESAISV